MQPTSIYPSRTYARMHEIDSNLACHSASVQLTKAPEPKRSDSHFLVMFIAHISYAKN